MELLIPAITLLCLHRELIQLAHIWSAVGGSVFLAWFLWQFRGEPALARGFLGQMASAIAVSGALFGLDYALAPFLDPAIGSSKEAAWMALAARIALFCGGYLLFLRLTHWKFLGSLRRK